MLEPAAFPEFFREVTGREPFPWQVRLAEQLCTGNPPALVDVPTGLGKTSVIIAWAFALAAELEGRAERRLPLRLVYVVDRRVIVDSTYELARRLVERLDPAAPAGPVAARVAAALQGLAGADARPLEAVRMRGGVTWDARWLDRPHQPAVVVSTVDQFGSRLLFRGYGVTPSMAPINAALCGLDAWVVVDEAHIAEPLAETLDRVRRLQRAAAEASLPHLKLTLMSATARTALAGGLRLTATLETETAAGSAAAEVARRRLSVPKPARLESVDVRGKGIERYRNLGAQLAERLASLSKLPGRYAVLCNTVQAARSAFEHLEKHRPGTNWLLTGRVREFEREQLVPDVLSRFGSGTPAPADALNLVATQTVEVGADLDFDAIVTECAPLASLIQRFGRVRRMGEPHAATSAVIYCPQTHDDDPVYGPATRSTRDLLEQVSPGENVDFSYRGVLQLRQAAPPGVEIEPPFIPVLLGAHVERWAQTSPLPAVDQPVAPFLHGFQRGGAPQVYIAWRAFPQGLEPGEWAGWLDLAPLSDWETVAVPLAEARAFLAGKPSESIDADIESAAEQAGSEPQANGQVARAVIYAGPDEPPAPLKYPEEIQPNATIVVDSLEGGHDRWGWNGRRNDSAAPRPVPDVADLAPSRRRRSLRLAPSIALSHATDPEAEARILDAWARLDPEDLDSTVPAICEAFASLVPEPLADLYRDAAEGIRNKSWEAFLPARDPETGQWRVAEADKPVVRLVEHANVATSADRSDDDALSTSLSASEPVPLIDHCTRVGGLARDFAERLGLAPDLVRAVELAGRFHDIGKAEPRFQAALYDGDALAALAGTPRAKSGRDPRDPVARNAHRLAGLPQGFRHEAVSARLVRALAQARPDLFDGVDLDLVHHLVVAHHGRGRPLLPPIDDANAPPTSLEIEGAALTVPGERYQVDWEHPARFEQLNQRYGWWGLALLETIVRLADMKDSELAARGAEARPGEVPPRSASPLPAGAPHA
ncbi:type I-G CRISPR-associated helicase/endonuclease Cas3g [Tepidiforma thermophila]|uniref:CRISPR-associated endonuclease/helicase Cas3 n=1 Tax=Tepidiforma thermophila (strain KCTC 52669 / CGMCC 1.13589 / G233) TaxID=2761530 RepID=A0A2A9HAW1_TEPT2|nr:type I-U CRISPR-associated helicase/endonuclease Cas3 [Tepidiforma thermophila]PFG73084.1 CRISPR-associated endonuclease/helicase Cas3 [Tepidiforma thermophila]